MGKFRPTLPSWDGSGVVSYSAQIEPVLQQQGMAEDYFNYPFDRQVDSRVWWVGCSLWTLSGKVFLGTLTMIPVSTVSMPSEPVSPSARLTIRR